MWWWEGMVVYSNCFLGRDHREMRFSIRHPKPSHVVTYCIIDLLLFSRSPLDFARLRLNIYDSGAFYALRLGFLFSW